MSSGEAQPRSYQGVVDDKVRECRFVQVEWSACPELGNFATRCIEPEFDVSVQSNPSDPVMLYCYSKGVGFLPHHDEVTEIEMRRGRHNGQPVVHGDLTIVAFLNDGEEYGGGELFFPDHGVSFKPAAGSVAVFPATRAFIHGVAPISAGSRFTCVARCFVRERQRPASRARKAPILPQTRSSTTTGISRAVFCW